MKTAAQTKQETGMTHTTYCDQGHPAHDGELGCGPCRDDRAAGLGERRYARPRRVYRREDGTIIDTRKVGRTAVKR